MSPRSARSIRHAAVVAALLLGVAWPAGAADPVTPDSAHALETQMRQFLADTVGPNVPLPPRPVEVTADGDHYDVSIPFAVLLGSAGTPAAGTGALTAALKPLDQDKWAIDDLKMPSPGHFAFDFGAKGKKLPAEVDVTIADQNTHALFDQSFATPSTLNSTVGALDLHFSSAMQDQKQHIDGYTVQAAMTPTTASRVDLTENVAARGLAVQARTSDDHAVNLAAEHVSVAAHLDDVDRLKVLAAVQALARMSGELAAAVQPAAVPPPPPPPARPKPGQRPAPPPPVAAKPPADAAAEAVVKSLVRNLVLTLRDIASGGEIDEALDNLKLTFDGHAGAVEHVRFGIGAAAPSGVLDAHFDMSLDGLVLAELPVSMAAYVPRHLKLRPFVGGISMADVTRMVLTATDPDRSPSAPMPDPSDLFSHGGISFGLESLLIDLGDTSLSGSAKMLATAPNQVAGKAQLTATHFDALMQMVQQDPMLQGGFPVLLMLRGLGRVAADQTIWDVTVDNGQVTVNGTDLSAMMGGKK